MNLISLTTDFGLDDWFVGTMKGVIYGLNSRATIVDLTHALPSENIRAGAFALAVGYRYFPRHTVHVVVVDPGVGGPRHALAVQTADYLFVGPDNGVLSWALAKEKILQVRRLENSKYFLPHVSHTFHGRDIFAPVAAHLSKGVALSKLGPAAPAFVRLPWPEPKQNGQATEGEILYLDHFGNAMTNLPNHLFEPLHKCWTVYAAPKLRCRVSSSYQSVPLGRPVAVPGSSGFLEIAINGGNAAHQLQLQVGTKVQVKAEA